MKFLLDAVGLTSISASSFSPSAVPPVAQSKNVLMVAAGEEKLGWAVMIFACSIPIPLEVHSIITQHKYSDGQRGWNSSWDPPLVHSAGNY